MGRGEAREWAGPSPELAEASCRLAQRGSQPDTASSHPPEEEEELEEELEEKNEKDKDKEISISSSSAVKMKEEQDERGE